VFLPKPSPSHKPVTNPPAAERERAWKEEVERRGISDTAGPPRIADGPPSRDGGEHDEAEQPRQAAIEARPVAGSGNDVQALLDPGVEEGGVPVMQMPPGVPDIKLDDPGNYSTNV
jgi:hypothetical protein